jgi:hypothetical protein
MELDGLFTLFAALLTGHEYLTIRDNAKTIRAARPFGHVLILQFFLINHFLRYLVLIGYLWAPSSPILWHLLSAAVVLFPEACRKLGNSMLLAYERMDLVATMDVLTVIFRHIPVSHCHLSGGITSAAFHFWRSSGGASPHGICFDQKILCQPGLFP